MNLIQKKCSREIHRLPLFVAQKIEGFIFTPYNQQIVFSHSLTHISLVDNFVCTGT